MAVHLAVAGDVFDGVLSSIQNSGSGTKHVGARLTPGFWDKTCWGSSHPNRLPQNRVGALVVYRVGVLVQHFGTPPHRATGPPTRPRATPYMVRVLVQPLEHHPTEPQGHQPDSDNIEGGFWDTFR